MLAVPAPVSVPISGFAPPRGIELRDFPAARSG
jgi:hypothetical protein